MKTLRNRIVATTLAALAGILLFGLILTSVEARLRLEALQDEMKGNNDSICEEYERYSFAGEAVGRQSDQVLRSSFNIVRLFLEGEPELYLSEAFMDQIVAATKAQDILFLDRTGKVLTSHKGVLKDLSDEMYAPLLETFESGQMEKLEIFPYSAETRALRIQALPEMGGDDEAVEPATDDASGTEGSIWETSEYGLENHFPILYSMAMDDNVACVINDYGLARMGYEDLTDMWDSVLRNDVIGVGGYAFAWSDETDEILYHPDESLKKKDVSVLGVDPSKIESDTFVEQRVMDQDMYLYPVHLLEQHAWVACAVPTDELTGNGNPAWLLLWLIFTILAADLACYAILLLRQRRTARETGMRPFARKRPEASKRVKLLAFTVFCTIVVFMSSFYLQTLYLMSSWTKTTTAQIDRIEGDLERGEILQETISLGFANANDEVLARLAGLYIEEHPDDVTTQTLDLLTGILNLQGISVVDETGAWVATSSAHTMGTTSRSETGKAGEASPDSGTGDQAASDGDAEAAAILPVVSPETHSVTIPLEVKDSDVNWHLTAECTQTLPFVVQSVTSLNDTLRRFRPGEGGFAFAVDQSSTRFTSYPDEQIIGKNALDFGLRETDLQDNLCKYISLNGQRHYAMTGQYGSDLIYIAIPTSELFRHRLALSIVATLASLILLLLTGLALYTCPDAVGETEPGTAEDEGDGYRSKTAEYKAFRNLALGATGLAAMIVALRHFAGDDMLDYVLAGNWENGLNVFALTASLIVVVEGGLCLFGFRKFTELLTVMLSVRSRTVIQMICGLVNYAGACVIGYLCLVNLGMDPTVLMTSAGIISVVIGIGANSLVGDIIAGVFLLAEGNVRVGDMICVGEFRGVVEDLGIRMTRVYDIVTEDVKIIRNSEVQNVVHLSMHPANVQIDYLIGYDEDLKRVEALLKGHLSTMRDRIPEIVATPIYQGVQELGSDGVALRVSVKCHEAYRFGVMRAVNRDIYLMLCDNGIEVPYPQLTLHEGDAAAADSTRPTQEPTTDTRETPH